MTVESDNVIYFAYGSNMSTRRLHARLPDAVPIGKGLLENYRFICNKLSKDGSSKGNIHPDEDSIVWGVLFEIPKSCLQELDKFERDYDRISVQIKTEDETISAVTYQSEKTTNELPFNHYMAHIITGALEHNLPDEYVQMLHKIPTKTEKVA